MRKLIFLIAVSVLIFSANQQTPNDENEELTDTLINDTIIELFNNCTCIPYYECSEANSYTYVAHKIRTVRKMCSKNTFTCCKEVTDPEGEESNSSTNSNKMTITAPSPIINLDPIVRGMGYECGVAKTTIGFRILTPNVASASTIPGEMPWMVQILEKRNINHLQQPYKFKGGGSLIHPKVILTATHIVVSNVRKPQTLKIVANGKEFFQNVGINPEDERNVLKVIKHPDYYSGGFYNDISLLILDREYNYSNTVQNSVCLPKKNQTFTGKCLAAGWGENENLESLPLRKVDLPIVNREKCQSLLRRTYLGVNFNLHSSFICAGGEAGKDTCKGDGGGPLICLGEEFQFVIAGIVSWGLPDSCGVVDQPGMYTDVTKFTEWIHGELSKNKIELN